MSYIITEIDKNIYINLFKIEFEEAFENIAGILNDILQYNDLFSGNWDNDLKDIIEIISYYDQENDDIESFVRYFEKYVFNIYNISEEQKEYVYELVNEVYN